MDPLVWKNRGEIFKFISMGQIGDPSLIDPFHVKKGAKFLILCLDTQVSLDDISCPQAKAPEKRR